MKRLKNRMQDPSCGWQFDLSALLGSACTLSGTSLDDLYERSETVLRINGCCVPENLGAIIESQIAERIDPSFAEEVL